MRPLPPEITADQMLQMFHSDAPFLFLGSAIAAVGIVAAAFTVMRRRYDPLLIYFALFAVLYGARIWVQTSLIELAFLGWPLFPRFRSALDFVVPIPAFLFFYFAGFVYRQAKIAGCILFIVLISLAALTLAAGPRTVYYQINNFLIIAALVIIVVQSFRGKAVSRDFVVMRGGLLVFVGFALWRNVQSVLLISFPNLEPIGFVAFLSTLGYVAARQALHRDQQLGAIQKELEVAKKIQLSILPGEFPTSSKFRVAARYVPMTAVAGDFYDFILAEDVRAGLLIADVSGHGVPAALIASMVKLAATSQRFNAADPSALLAGMNAVLYGHTQHQFVTAAYVYLDSSAGELRYSAAGHPPMLLLRNGGVTEIVENGLMLAAFDFAAYTNAVQRLEPGDRLLLYTDGLIEAADSRGEFFGQQSLSEQLRATAALTPANAADSIVCSVQQWSHSQDDDLTLLICDYSTSA